MMTDTAQRFDAAAFASQFLTALREAGKTQTELAQAMNVAGESGEAVEAIRRYIGFARRAGSLDEVAAELADVEIAANVFATLADVTICQPMMHSGTAERVEIETLLMYRAAGLFVDAYIMVDSKTWPMTHNLGRLIMRARRGAEQLGIDHDAALASKTAVIMSRGFGHQTGEPA